MTLAAIDRPTEFLRALPGDDVRQILWRFADRYDLQMLVQSVRAVARGPVARLVAQGARNTHEWTAEKQALLAAFDESGVTGVFMDPAQGGFIEGPKNLALALVAFELAWVDAGAATGSLAGCLALSPIHERGTQQQRDRYMALAAPPQPGENRKPWRGAFCLTEPIPYVGVETGMLGGRVRVSEWAEGQEPMLRVERVRLRHELDRRQEAARPADGHPRAGRGEDPGDAPARLRRDAPLGDQGGRMVADPARCRARHRRRTRPSDHLRALT